MSMLSRRHAVAGAAGLAAFGMGRHARAGASVRIGFQKNGSLVILRQQKRLEQMGLAVQWVDFPSGPPLLEALNAGALDFGATGDTPPIFAQVAGADLLYVGAQPVAGRNQAILVPKDSTVRGAADLRGKRVAFTKGSSAHNLIVLYLATAGMKPADIQPVNLQPPDAAAAFRNGSLDAWVVWDPFFAATELEPTTRVLTTSEGVAPSNAFFLARRGFAEEQAPVLRQLLDAINGAAAWAATHETELVALLTEVTGVPERVQRVAALRGVYAAQKLDAAIIAQQQGIADRFFDLRIIPSRVDVASIVWKPPT